MLEIIGLVFLTKKMGNLADEKGLKPGPWKVYVVLAWFAGEIIGVVLGSLLFQDIAGAIILGYGFAIASYFILKSVLSKKPDQLMEEEINQIGQPQV